ncbi:MAG: hypothetical protein NTX50_18435 [Candidatus Sumerlaeota bacterium]|nr:hypothetical protein [Candidatus Sumerlaeota bacterium]
MGARAKEKPTVERLGLADQATKDYRDSCLKSGVRVAFRSSMTREETLKFLARPETQKMLKDPNEYLYQKYYKDKG